MWSFAQTATPAPGTQGSTTPPPTFNSALADLNKRLGLQLTLASFDNPTSRWQWDYRVFSNTALDCAAPGQAFEIKQVPGYEYYFLYLGRSYDYRITETGDASQLLYCRYPDRLPTAPASLTTSLTLTPGASTGTTNTGALVDANGTPIANTSTTSGSTTTPDAVNQALSLLNTRLKTTLTLNDLSTASTFWRWVPRDFTNDALECPRTGYTPIVGTYPGYVITFYYKGITYEFRAPQSDATATFLCSIN
jgi:hypothetical protein